MLVFVNSRNIKRVLEDGTFRVGERDHRVR